MNILAVDSSGLTASAAVYIDEKIVDVNTVNNNKTHSQTLLPMISNVIQQAGLTPDELSAIAVAEGPGSFTGLRIGASTVKGLAFALNKPVIPVSSLAGLAFNAAAAYDCIICPIMDARRNQVYTALYKSGELLPEEIVKPMAVAIDDVLDLCDAYDKVMFLGDGVFVHTGHIKERLGGKAFFAKPHFNLQNAASVAVIAAELYKEGKYVSGAEFEPVYLRLSQAERERLENEKK